MSGPHASNFSFTGGPHACYFFFQWRTARIILRAVHRYFVFFFFLFWRQIAKFGGNHQNDPPRRDRPPPAAGTTFSMRADRRPFVHDPHCKRYRAPSDTCEASSAALALTLAPPLAAAARAWCSLRRAPPLHNKTCPQAADEFRDCHYSLLPREREAPLHSPNKLHGTGSVGFLPKARRRAS